EYLTAPETAVLEAAKEFQCIMVGKNATTLIASYDTDRIYMNIFGNDGMATAGSGDVLAGIIGGLLAQQREPMRAVITGVYLHAKAGEKAADLKSNYGVTAGDMIESLW
ncbi:MAG: hydroxyethylthiazole kinase, partial [Lachnospiraceae bacterium]|nr:hydroxyethylthiazole kinase [Lachnospiraceae bacterium]